MDKDRVAGAGKQISGTVRERLGKLVGDAKLQADGTTEKAIGKAQNLVGSIKDTLKP